MDAIHNLAHGNADEAFREATPANRKIDAEERPAEDDDLAPARGLLASVLLGGGLWLILLTVGWLIFR